MQQVASDPVSPAHPAAVSADETARVDLPTGVTLAYRAQGAPNGVPVVLLHGISDSLRSFELVLPHLDPSVRAFALSQRGHGESSRPATGYHPRDFAADAIAFLDAQGIERAVVVGHSMGSGVAQQVAVTYPERVRGLVLMGAIVMAQDHPTWSALADEIASLEDPIDPAFVTAFQESTITQPVPDGYFDVVVRESLKVPARIWKAIVAEFQATDLTAELRTVTAPTLVTWGDQDSYGTRADQGALLTAIPHARLTMYPGAGHALHWEEPRRFAQDLTAFVGSLA